MFNARLILFLCFVQPTLSDLECRPLGPVVPHPRNLSGSESLQNALSTFVTNLTHILNGDKPAPWPVINVSFSLGIIGIEQKDPSVPLWEFHHLASGNVNGTKRLDRNSQYMIGSISKVISDAILLKTGLSLDDPITKYLPQLNSSHSLIRWNEVSLRAVASQLSGMPPNYGFSEFYYLRDYFEYLGFPSLNDSDYGPCGVIGLNGDCSKEQFLEGLLHVYPVAPPMQRPVYSNVAFTLFMYAIQEVTGMNYTEQLRHFITEPLKMTNTVESPGTESVAVVPPVVNSWGSTYGDFAPGGGLISTLSDLTTFVHSILSRSLLPTPTAVREWLQPRSFAGSPFTFVGTPWEIFQPPISGDLSLTPAHPHTVTVVGKAGAAYGYRSQVALLDDYGVGLVVLVAGDADALSALYDALLATVTQAVDNVARDEADSRGYTGSFLGPCSSGEGEKVSGLDCINVTLTQDVDSIIITGMYRNGSDILAGIQSVWTYSLGVFLEELGSTFRVFPAEVSSTDNSSSRATVREDWRIWWDVEFPGGTLLPGAGLAKKDCLVWSYADWLYYGGEPLDRLVFILDLETRQVVGLEVPFLRSGILTRSSNRTDG